MSPPGIGGSSLAFTAAFPKYLTPRVFGLKHYSASIRHVHQSQTSRHIFRVRKVVPNFLFSQGALRALAAPSPHDMLFSFSCFDERIDDCHQCVGHVPRPRRNHPHGVQ